MTFQFFHWDRLIGRRGSFVWIGIDCWTPEGTRAVWIWQRGPE